MRKWCLWYTAGFRGASALRGELLRITSPAQMLAILARLDPDEPFPLSGLRASRAKDGRRQEVRLPHGYLTAADDDAPLPEPQDARTRSAWEAALSGG